MPLPKRGAISRRSWLRASVLTPLAGAAAAGATAPDPRPVALSARDRIRNRYLPNVVLRTTTPTK